MPRPAAQYNRRKWQLIGKSQWCCSANCGHPIARVNVQLNPRHAASKHTTAPINHTEPSPRKLSPDGADRARKHTSEYSLLLSLSTSKGWKAESTWLAGYIPKQKIRSVEHGICPIAEFTSPWLNGAHSNRIPYPLRSWCRGVHVLLKNIKRILKSH